MVKKYNSRQQLLLALYVFASQQKIVGERVRAIIDSHKSVQAPKGYEPFAGED